MKKYNFFFMLVLLTILSSCLGGGTHGFIKYYEYNVSKQTLETAVKSVIKESESIKQDSISGYYNNDTTYITFTLITSDAANQYTVRYSGDKQDWDTAKTSSISIVYAYKDQGIGGSEGNGGIKKNDYKLRKELIEPFEHKFISKINMKLGLKPYHESED